MVAGQLVFRARPVVFRFSEIAPSPPATHRNLATPAFMATEKRPKNSRCGADGNRGLELSVRAGLLRICSAAATVMSRVAHAWPWRCLVCVFCFPEALDRTARSASQPTKISAAPGTAARLFDCARAHDWLLARAVHYVHCRSCLFRGSDRDWRGVNVRSGVLGFLGQRADLFRKLETDPSNHAGRPPSAHQQFL